MVICEIC